MEGIKSYFRCMFRALRDIHIRGIIHRDVKPANFLFDPRTGIGTLCDFGLASRMEAGPMPGACLHGPPSARNPHGENKVRYQYNHESVVKLQREARAKSKLPSEKVGYPDKDTRPVSKANRAGTRGFRAPEVLLKCGEQTGALDVWAAGIILLFFLTKKVSLVPIQRRRGSSHGDRCYHWEEEDGRCGYAAQSNIRYKRTKCGQRSPLVRVCHQAESGYTHSQRTRYPLLPTQFLLSDHPPSTDYRAIPTSTYFLLPCSC